MPSSERSAGRNACAKCGQAAAGGLRRGRCPACYEKWVKQKPVGLGAVCVVCGERRHVVLRHFELHRSWLVLCHNCAARVEALRPQPRSVEGLRVELARERRQGERRGDAGPDHPLLPLERRRADRRTAAEEIVDANGLVIEIEAEFGAETEPFDLVDEPAAQTMIHAEEEEDEDEDEDDSHPLIYPPLLAVRRSVGGGAPN